MANVLVTGGNRGIGLELCRQLAARGEQVIAVVRKASPTLSALDVEVLDKVDVATDEGLSRIVAGVGDRPLSMVINNAGIMRHTPLLALEPDDIRAQLEVNALAPLRVTEALLPRLSKGSKVALVTSRMGSIDDNTSGGSYGYRMSKAALNAAGKSLAVDLAERGIAVAILHPGWVQTDMTGGTGQLSAARSAELLLARIDELSLATTGTFWHANGEVLPW